MNLLQYIICAVILYLIIKRDDSAYEMNKEKCRNCGKIIESNSLICPNCQEEVKKTCDRCGSLMDIDWRYCPFCKNNEKK